MAVTYGQIKLSDDDKLYDFSVADLDKMTEIKGFSRGGFVTPGKYPVAGEAWIGANTSTVIRTLKYTHTDENGNTKTVHADVLHDGTIHVDPSAFTMLMEALGYKDDNPNA